MDTLLLIDGNAIMHRAYHAYPPLTANDGTPTHMVYGYLSMIHKVVSDFKPTHLISCFDTPKPTFRNALFKEYQIQRLKIEDDFIVQIPMVKEALDIAGVARMEKDGYEADDVIGTFARAFEANKFKVIILTGDKDIFQLITDNVFVASPQMGLSNIKLYDATEVKLKLDIPPNHIIDYKALSGDPSDNYPGAHGIGPKTAVKLINEFGTIDNIYKNLDSISSEKVRTILEKEKDKVYLSKELATIKCDVDVNLDIQKIKFSGFNKNLIEYLEKYQMSSLVGRIFNERRPIKKEEPKKKSDQMGLF